MIRSYGLLLLPLLFLSGAGGCIETTEDWQSHELSSDTSRVPGVADHFDAAMDYLYHLDEFDPQQARAQAAFNLNQWVARQSPDEQWIADPLVSRLPREIQATPPLQELAELNFRLDDIKFLQEAIWARSISRWAVDQPAADALLRVEQTEGLSDADRRQLLLASRLFDWTIRNVQLDELLPRSTAAADVPTPEEISRQAAEVLAPPLLGEPGPGYTLYPWQVLMYGHGDAWQRARVFILLARQQQIEVVMLAFREEAAAQPAPWIPAVLLNQQLYLFDTSLGLPIPGPQQQGIATLTQVLDDPQVLRQLDTAELKYPVAAEDLPRLMVLIDASPGYLSQRMTLVQSRLTGDRKLVLNVSPSRLARQLRDLPGVSQVSLWLLPYETLLFRTVIEQSNAPNLQHEAMFETINPLTKARHQHFRGQWENETLESQEVREGAKPLYLGARLPERAIEELLTSAHVQQQLGIVRGDASDAVWLRRMQVAQQMYRMAKLHATYWLGLAHYEAENYQVAADWLETQVLGEGLESPWTTGARYNLARCYEALHQVAEAAKLLSEDQSPQRHGNLLRAQWLQAQGEEPKPEERPRKEQVMKNEAGGNRTLARAG